MKATFVRCAAFCLSAVCWMNAAQFDLVTPSGSGAFGKATAVLPNGNIVVADPQFDDGAIVDVGAVYLYHADGTLVSTLKGSQAGDQVGAGGITVLTNGNFLVKSQAWHSGANAVGAVTWVNGSTGLNATVSSSNSLIGATANDMNLVTISFLKNGNYLVRCTGRDNGATADAGSVTFGNANTGVSGVISAANSLVGTTANEQLGASVTLLNNGNYVVRSSGWANGAATNAGAVTWGSGTTGVVGAESASISLVGSSTGDQVGIGFSVVVLANNNYVVLSPNWKNGLATAAGAATLCSGTAPTTGAVSATNSLVGSQSNDGVGSSCIPLTNGNYVVGSSAWKNGSAASAGAATWGNGVTGVVGAVSSSNSLVGTAANDKVGTSLVALTNGNYVVNNLLWNGNTGAVTWGNGSTGITGAVSSSNSLVGAAANCFVGQSGVDALSSGNYLVRSAAWDNGATADVGAVTFCNGTTGRTGVVSASNSLVGSTTNDQVGFAMTLLSNGNFVIRSKFWDNGSTVDAGAATWGSGTSGPPTGPVTIRNSLVGTHTNDLVSGDGVLALSNGNYVVISSGWDSDIAADIGAVTWANGTTGIYGAVSAGNSLIGTTPGDAIGIGGGLQLTNGHYVVSSTSWANTGAPSAGAVTWCDGTKGLIGTVSAANSLVGSRTNDLVGAHSLTALTNGNYVVRSRFWNNGAITEAGMIAIGDGSKGTVGVVSASNALIGGTTMDHVAGFSVTSFSNDTFLAHSTEWDNGAVPNATAVTLGRGSVPLAGLVSVTNSIVGNVSGGSSSLVYAYDPTSDVLAVGKPLENKVTVLGNTPGKIAFESPVLTFNETAGTVLVKLVRTGGTEGSVTVKISTSSVGGTATKDSDYTSITSQDVVFAPGVTSMQVPVTILTDSVSNEANETFNLTLTGTASQIGALSSTTVRILDSASGDVTAPSVPVITAPLANAHLNVNPGGKVTITGTAKDNKGLSDVLVSFNGAAAQSATLSNHSGTTANWSITVTPVTGLNTISVHAVDTSGLGSATDAVRSFFVARPLIVNALGGAGFGAASFTAGYVPASYREPGKPCTITATPPPSSIFTRWTITGGVKTPADIGLTDAQLELPTITFIYREGLILTANFVTNPYNFFGVAGIYNGTIHASSTLPDRLPVGAGAEDGTTLTNATEGGIGLTVLTTGGFTGKLAIDGMSLPVAGTFDDQGVARFGAQRDRVLSVPRTNKTSLQLTLLIDVTAPTYGSMTGTLTDYGLAVSDIKADRNPFNGVTVLPFSLLTGTLGNGVFNIKFTPQVAPSQPGGLTTDRYPLGHSFGTATVTKAGAVNFSGTLSDGSAVTASSAVDQNLKWHCFTPLYNKKGFLLGDFVFDTAPTTSDVTATGLTWMRPILDDQYYPDGWPLGLYIDGIGSRLVVTTGSSVLPGLPAIDGDGNATLSFAYGGIPTPFVKNIGITATDVVQKPTPVDNSFALAITRSAGRFSGTFTHTGSGAKTSYQGIVIQKGTLSGGYGFFKTAAPVVKDYTGKIGEVLLQHQ